MRFKVQLSIELDKVDMEELDGNTILARSLKIQVSYTLHLPIHPL